jgi:hypothetical protein
MFENMSLKGITVLEGINKSQRKLSKEGDVLGAKRLLNENKMHKTRELKKQRPYI